MSNKYYVAAADYTSLAAYQADLDAKVPAICVDILGMIALYQKFAGQGYAALGEAGTPGVQAKLSDVVIFERLAAMLQNGGCARVLEVGSNHTFPTAATFAQLITDFASGTGWNQP